MFDSCKVLEPLPLLFHKLAFFCGIKLKVSKHWREKKSKRIKVPQLTQFAAEILILENSFTENCSVWNWICNVMDWKCGRSEYRERQNSDDRNKIKVLRSCCTFQHKEKWQGWQKNSAPSQVAVRSPQLSWRDLHKHSAEELKKRTLKRGQTATGCNRMLQIHFDRLHSDVTWSTRPGWTRCKEKKTISHIFTEAVAVIY